MRKRVFHRATVLAILLCIYGVLATELECSPASKSHGPRGLKLIIASHNRLLVHDVETGAHTTLHTGLGVYYSVLSHTLNNFWVSIRGMSEREEDFLVN